MSVTFRSVLIFMPLFTFAADPDAQVSNRSFLCNKVRSQESGQAPHPMHHFSSNNLVQPQATSHVREYNSEPLGGRRTGKSTHLPPILKKFMNKKKTTDSSNSPSLADMYDELLIMIFKVEFNKRKECSAQAKWCRNHARECLVRFIDEVLKSTGQESFNHFNQRQQYYSKILLRDECEEFGLNQDLYDFALDGIQLVKRIHEKDNEKNEKLYITIEEILEVSGSIFEKNAKTEVGSLEWLERTLKVIGDFRQEQLQHLPSLITIARVNTFDRVVKEARYPTHSDFSTDKKETKEE